MASQQYEPPSGTRDLLAGALRTREHVFAQIRGVWECLINGGSDDQGDAR